MFNKVLNRLDDSIKVYVALFTPLMAAYIQGNLDLCYLLFSNFTFTI